MIVDVIDCRAHTYAPPDAVPEAMRQATYGLQNLPSSVPGVVRFEWGKLKESNVNDEREQFVYVAAFRHFDDALDEEYEQYVHKLGGRYAIVAGMKYLMHDATPDVRVSTHGCLQHLLTVRSNGNNSDAIMDQIEESLAALPQKIPSIMKLNWGSGFRSTKITPHTRLPGVDMNNPVEVAEALSELDPLERNGNYIVFMTFADEESRDACVAHPAYEELGQVISKHWKLGLVHPAEYIAHVDYVEAQD